LTNVVDLYQLKSQKTDVQSFNYYKQEYIVGALKELFLTPEGLLSLGLFVFMIGMGIYLVKMFISKMNNDQ